MCGIAGFAGKNLDHLNKSLISKMLVSIYHRGPDASNHWTDKNQTVTLGHNRLSIIDLSEKANQPFISRSGRWVLAFNGEIYNHLVLRNSLGKFNWKTSSDTESLLEHIDSFGLLNTLREAKGMFAFAAWDNLEKKLFLVRDRFGEKPIYYHNSDTEGIFFASELKALKYIPNFKKNINQNAVTSFFFTGCISNEASIFQGISKLKPAHYLVYNPENNSINQGCYWNISEYSNQNIYKKDFVLADLEEQVEGKIRNSIKDQMIADVPIGSFLSSGIDSSLVTAIMSQESSNKIKTFSVGIEGKNSEAIGARKISEFLGTDHHELVCSPSDITNRIEELISVYDEPFADSSQIPTLLVSELAKREVKVVLTGDAGDEVFGGYNRYAFVAKYWENIKRVPNLFKKGAGHLNSKLLFNSFTNKLMGKFIKSYENPFLKASKFLDAIESRDVIELYNSFVSVGWKSHQDIFSSDFISEYEEVSISRIETVDSSRTDFDNILLLDFQNYLPSDILTKVDRATMSVSLESRTPYLDHELVEFMLSIPAHLKYANQDPMHSSKFLLRNILYKYLPKELYSRPKTGFGIPIGEWLKSDLNEWAEDLLSVNELSKIPMLNSKSIRQHWDSHLKGYQDNTAKLWNVIIFMNWLKKEGVSF